MLKLTGATENVVNVHLVPQTKYIFSTNSAGNNLSGQVEFGNGPIGHKPSAYINELGKLLSIAASVGNVDEIKQLLSKGAPFTSDWLGTGPLHLAAQNNHVNAVEVLLRAGIKKDIRTKVDRTPLHMATYEGHLEVVEALVKHGADINCKDLLGMTPLHWAVQRGHLEIVEYLIKSGANIEETNKFDLTPAMIAKQINRMDIRNCLENSLATSAIAAQNLTILLGSEDNNEDGSIINGTVEMDVDSQQPIIIPLEPSIITQLQQQDGGEGNEEREEPSIQYISSDNEEVSALNTTNLTDSLKLLQEHGITMLQNENEDTNILNTVMESGHSVVLTDVGKEVLNSVKEKEQQQEQTQQQPVAPQIGKIMTVTPEEFFALANESMAKNVSKPIKIRRHIIKKNKVPVPAQNTEENLPNSDMEVVMNQLIEAKQTIEDLKAQLHNKELEAERYKMQLKMLMDPS